MRRKLIEVLQQQKPGLRIGSSADCRSVIAALTLL
jgi:hypothetical protein